MDIVTVDDQSSVSRFGGRSRLVVSKTAHCVALLCWSWFFKRASNTRFTASPLIFTPRIVVSHMRNLRISKFDTDSPVAVKCKLAFFRPSTCKHFSSQKLKHTDNNKTYGGPNFKNIHRQALRNLSNDNTHEFSSVVCFFAY